LGEHDIDAGREGQKRKAAARKKERRAKIIQSTSPKIERKEHGREGIDGVLFGF